MCRQGRAPVRSRACAQRACEAIRSVCTVCLQGVAVQQSPPWQRGCQCCRRSHAEHVGARLVSSARQRRAFAAARGTDAEKYAPFSRPSHCETCPEILLGHYMQWRARGADGQRASAPLMQLLLARRALASPAARPVASLRYDSRSASRLDHSCRAAQAFDRNPLHLGRAPPRRPAQRSRARGDLRAFGCDPRLRERAAQRIAFPGTLRALVRR